MEAISGHRSKDGRVPTGSEDRFNLIHSPWIPVLWRNGRFDRVGIWTALAEAGHIRQIAASNPMDNVALLRFLLAVLMWCRPGLSEEDRQTLEGAKGIPEDWLEQLKEHNAAFNLLGEGKRFYQDKSVENNARPVGDLLVEFPTETKIAHFRHVRDQDYGLCPACCALGVVRFCAFANAYGGGRYTSAANGPTPAYSLLLGATLLETLRLNLPEETGLKRDPPWMTNVAPKRDELDYATVFAWRSRRLWLGDPGAKGDCAHCGTTEHLIRQIAFTGNWKPPFATTGTQKKFWDADPHLILVDKTAADEDGEESESNAGQDPEPSRSRKRKKKPPVKTTLGFPAPSSKSAVHARFWRRALAARMEMRAEDACESGHVLSILIAGPAANQGLYQDAASLCLNVGADAKVLDSQTKAVEKLANELRRGTPNPDRQHPERAAARDALSPSLEAVFRVEAKTPLQGSADPAVLTRKLSQHLATVVDRAVTATTPGSSLRRREASRRAKLSLDQALSRDTAAPPATPAAVNTIDGTGAKGAKPRRTRKKKDGA